MQPDADWHQNLCILKGSLLYFVKSNHRLLPERPIVDQNTAKIAFDQNY